MARACTTAQYFTIGTAPALSITGNMTFMAWILGSGAVGGRLFCAFNDSTDFVGYGVRVHGDGNLAYWSNGIGTWMLSSGVVNTGVWIPVGITISGTGAGAGTFWINGAASGTFTHTSPGAGNLTKGIGADVNAFSSILGYTLAEIAVWNVALSSGEIASYGNGTLSSSIQSGNLVAYWRLLGTASPEPDIGPNGYSATLVGTPTQVAHPPVFVSTNINVGDSLGVGDQRSIPV